MTEAMTPGELVAMYEQRCADLEAELARVRAALLAHCPNCCDIRWHHGQEATP